MPASTRWKTSTARTFPRADWFDYSTIRRQAERLREQGFAVCCGTAGDMDFINSIARARGMEQVLMDLIDDNPVYLEIMQARFEFYYEMHRRMLEAAGGLIDFTHVGDDLGNQRGPDDRPGHLREALRPEVRQVFRDGPRARRPDDDAHVRLRGEVPAAADRDWAWTSTTWSSRPRRRWTSPCLQERFGDRLTFCGSVCVQTTLAWGTPADVEREVRRRLDLFPAGRAVPRPHARHPGRLAAGEHPGHVPHGRQPVREDRRVDPEHRGRRPARSKSTCRSCSERRRAGKPQPWRAGGSAATRRGYASGITGAGRLMRHPRAADKTRGYASGITPAGEARDGDREHGEPQGGRR